MSLVLFGVMQQVAHSRGSGGTPGCHCEVSNTLFYRHVESCKSIDYD